MNVSDVHILENNPRFKFKPKPAEPKPPTPRSVVDPELREDMDSAALQSEIGRFVEILYRRHGRAWVISELERHVGELHRRRP